MLPFTEVDSEAEERDSDGQSLNSVFCICPVGCLSDREMMVTSGVISSFFVSIL